MLNTSGLYSILDLEVAADSPELIIYSENLGARLDYTCRFVFNHVLKVRFRITSDLKEFESSDAYKINYSKKDLKQVLNIAPHAILTERSLNCPAPRAVYDNNGIYFFSYKGSPPNGLHFDIFSAVFYLISRYEEWKEFPRDAHGRFEASASILHKNNCHLSPIVDKWILEFKNILKGYYPNLIFPEKKFRVISTIDVDNLFAYKHKGLLRTLGACARDVLKLDFKNLAERSKVLYGKKNDPFDVYDEVSSFCFDHKIPLICFFLFRSGTKHDRTVDPRSPAYKRVFEELKKNHAIIGVHPSYYSTVNENLLKKEIGKLSERSNERISFSRQHYLRFDIRKTPADLLRNGITGDFTMGFATEPGFRAGTSHPFYYYDFNKEKSSELLTIPFCAMDGAYTVYGKKSPAAAETSLMEIASEVKKVNGLFITVFHERSFSDHLYPGFGTLYKNLYSKLMEL